MAQKLPPPPPKSDGRFDDWVSALYRRLKELLEPVTEAIQALTPTQATDLTDGGDSTLHYHAEDRKRSNHTGTQTSQTISDFESRVRSLSTGTDHSQLFSLAWTQSGHTGTATTIGGFNASGVAEYLTRTGTGTVVVMSASPTFTGTINAAGVTLTGALSLANAMWTLIGGGNTFYADGSLGLLIQAPPTSNKVTIRDSSGVDRMVLTGSTGDTAFTGAVTGTRLLSTVTTGTAPLSVNSTTKVANLNADLLDGADWTSPGAIGSVAPNSGAFTTLSAAAAPAGALLNVQRSSDDNGVIASFGVLGTTFDFKRSNSTGALSIQGTQVGNNDIVLCPTSGNIGVAMSPARKLDVTGTFGVTGAATLADVSATTLADSKGDVRTIPQNSQSAAYTLVLADAGKHILHPSADTTARTFTIPPNAGGGAVAFPVGTAVTFVNQNAAGTITIAITTDTMRLAGAGTTGSRTLTANGIATALKITSTEWIISGTNLT